MLAERFTDRSIKEKNKQRVAQESKMEISEEIMNQINKKHFIKDRKEKKLFMLVTSREVFKVYKKIKWEYAPCEVSKEETK